MDTIRRHIEKHLLKLLNYFPVVGILGARQVGKTTLVNIIKEKLNKTFVYIDLESPSDKRKLEDPEVFLEFHKEKCVIIDEIQRNKELFPIIRSLVDKHKTPSRFIILGSASPELIRDSSESLAGRIAYIDLFPFNIYELQYKNINKHWLQGGFPLSVLANDIFYSSEWRENFIRTYIERDIPLLGLNVRNIDFRKFLNLLAHINAQILNYSNISKSMELTVPTINKYIDFLEKAFLLKKIPPFSNNNKKKVVKSSKLYFTDTGILHQLLSISTFDDLQANIYQGASWENYVIIQISSILKKEYNLYFYRTHNAAEIDLIIEGNNTILFAIEIKYSNSPKLSKGNYFAFQDIKAKNNIVITPSSDNYPIKNNIEIINLVDFIKKLVIEKHTIV